MSRNFIFVFPLVLPGSAVSPFRCWKAVKWELLRPWIQWVQRGGRRAGGRGAGGKGAGGCRRFRPFSEMSSTRAYYRSFTAGPTSPFLHAFCMFNKCSCVHPCVCLSLGMRETSASDFSRRFTKPNLGWSSRGFPHEAFTKSCLQPCTSAHSSVFMLQDGRQFSLASMVLAVWWLCSRWCLWIPHLSLFFIHWNLNTSFKCSMSSHIWF